MIDILGGLTPSFFMKEIIHRSIFLTEDECSVISDFVLNNEDKIKSMGPDHYDGTRDDSLTGRFYLFNYLNVPEINLILKPKLQNLFNDLNLESEIYVQCWANTYRKGDYINPHCHGGPSEEYLCANIFLRGFAEPGTTYYLDSGIVDLKNTVGEIVLFDSLTSHGVKAYRHDDIRITLAMDIHHGIGESITKTIFNSHPERYYKLVNK